MFRFTASLVIQVVSNHHDDVGFIHLISAKTCLKNIFKTGKPE